MNIKNGVQPINKIQVSLFKHNYHWKQKLINEMQAKVDIKHLSKVDQDKKVNGPSYLVYS
jgi:hypothetical protein